MKKIISIILIATLLVFSVSAKTVKTPKSTFGFQTSAFVESNLLANSFGGEVEGYYMPWNNFGFSLGVRGLGYFAFDDDAPSGVTPIKPSIMPYLALKFNSFELGGGVGLNLDVSEETQVTPYVRMNWDIPFTKAHEGNNNRFGMTVGAHWYLVMPIMNNYEAEDAGEAVASIFLALLEGIGQVAIPKVNVGFTYQFEHRPSIN